MGDMLVRLYSLPNIDPPADENLVIKRAIAPEKRIITNWVEEHFSKNWASECEVAFSREPAACFVAIKNKQLAGFACYETTCRNFFGPTGVLETEQGKGIGKLLLLHSLEAMREYGYAYAIIGDAGPAKYYEKIVDAIPIPGAEKGVYKNMLKE